MCSVVAVMRCRETQLSRLLSQQQVLPLLPLILLVWRGKMVGLLQPYHVSTLQASVAMRLHSNGTDAAMPSPCCGMDPCLQLLYWQQPLPPCKGMLPHSCLKHVCGQPQPCHSCVATPHAAPYMLMKHPPQSCVVTVASCSRPC